MLTRPCSNSAAHRLRASNLAAARCNLLVGHRAVGGLDHRMNHCAAEIALGDDAIGLVPVICRDRPPRPSIGRHLARVVAKHDSRARPLPDRRPQCPTSSPSSLPSGAGWIDRQQPRPRHVGKLVLTHPLARREWPASTARPAHRQGSPRSAPAARAACPR
jgi:hypothetical protein